MSTKHLGRPTTKAESGYCPEALKLGLAGALWWPDLSSVVGTTKEKGPWEL